MALKLSEKTSDASSMSIPAMDLHPRLMATEVDLYLRLMVTEVATVVASPLPAPYRPQLLRPLRSRIPILLAPLLPHLVPLLQPRRQYLSL